MDIFKFVSSMAFPLILGKILLDGFFAGRKKFPLGQNLFLSFGLGFGVITQLMFLLSLLKVTFVLAFLIPLLSVIILVVYWMSRRTTLRSGKDVGSPAGVKKPIFDPISASLILAMVVATAFLFFRTWVIEYDAWDSWTLWAFKAKIFFVHRLIPLELFSKFNTAYGCWDYPQHVPLMETWVLLWLGYWNDQWPRLIFPLFFTGTAFLVFHFLRSFVKQRYALAGTLFYVTVNNFQAWTMGTYAEPVMLFYYLAGFTLLCRWMSEQDIKLLILSAICSGLAGWTKNDGLLLFLGNLTVLLVFVGRQKGKLISLTHKWVWIYVGIVLALVLPWMIIVRFLGIDNVIVNPQSLRWDYILSQLGKFSQSGPLFGDLFQNFKRWNLLWYYFGAAVIFGLIKSGSKKIQYIFLSMGIQLGGIFFLCIIYPDLPSFMEVTIPRLMLAPAILAIFCVVLVFGDPAGPEEA